MKKFESSPIYLYHTKKKMAARGLSKESQGRWYIQLTDGTKLQVTPGRYAKVISEADYKWIAGAESKKWKRNKSTWDKYQTSRAQKIIASL